MSESKAQLRATGKQYSARLGELEDDIVFLLQALMDIGSEYPEIDLPALGDNRFPERIWRRISI